VTDIDSVVNVRHLAGDVAAAVTGPGGRQVVLDDPSGHPIELFTPAAR
jgi:hypothetical protein